MKKNKFQFNYFPFVDSPCGIYRISKIDTNFCYIGMSKQISRRWNEHFKSLKNKKHHCQALQKMYDKYGIESFRFEIVKICKESELGSLEQKVWDEHVDAGWKLLNSRPDGKGGYTKTPEIIDMQRISTSWWYELNRGKKRPEHSRFLKEKGKNFSYWRDDIQMFWCEKCNYGTNDSGQFEYHVNNNTHNDIKNDWKRGTGMYEDWFIKERDIFYCGYCDYETKSTGDFGKHLKNGIHLANIKGIPYYHDKIVNGVNSKLYDYSIKKYVCDCCEYSTTVSPTMTKHLQTKKHIDNSTKKDL